MFLTISCILEDVHEGNLQLLMRETIHITDSIAAGYRKGGNGRLSNNRGEDALVCGLMVHSEGSDNTMTLVCFCVIAETQM